MNYFCELSFGFRFWDYIVFLNRLEVSDGLERIEYDFISIGNYYGVVIYVLVDGSLVVWLLSWELEVF